MDTPFIPDLIDIAFEDRISDGYEPDDSFIPDYNPIDFCDHEWDEYFDDESSVEAGDYSQE